jgi:quercetin dioxygenase-like cupin family protein
MMTEMSSPGPFADLDDLSALRIWDGLVGRVVEGERMALVVIELDPDCVVPEHSHENEQLGIVLRGALTLRVGGEERTLGPGETWCIAPNIGHSGHAGPDGAVVIDVFSPPRDDWEGLDRLEAQPPRWP